MREISEKKQGLFLVERWNRYIAQKRFGHQLACAAGHSFSALFANNRNLEVCPSHIMLDNLSLAKKPPQGKKFQADIGV